MFQVDCDSLFAIDLLNMPSGITPQKLKQTEQIYQDYLLHGVDAKDYTLIMQTWGEEEWSLQILARFL